LPPKLLQYFGKLSTLDYGFNSLSIKLITGRALIENIASIKVLEKIGMDFISESIVDYCTLRTYTKAKTQFILQLFCH